MASLQGLNPPQHTWDLQNIAVWNTTARIHLNNHDPAWLQGPATAVSEAKWELRSHCVGNHYTLNETHADMPGFKTCQRLPSDKQQTSRNPTYSHK
eukprot:87382-Pelagomonas_calceolata.AAC.1